MWAPFTALKYKELGLLIYAREVDLPISLRLTHSESKLLLLRWLRSIAPESMVLLYSILLNSLGFALRILCLKNVLGIAERIHN